MSTIQQTSLVIFKKGAVLRHSDLNDIVNFFEQNQLASNRYLDGVGIVSGLELSYQNETISISKGIAVFPNGILIEIKEPCEFTFQTELNPLSKTISDHFSKLFRLHDEKDKIKITDLEGQCVLLGLENTSAGGSCFRENEVNERRNYKPVFYLGTPLKTEKKPETCFTAIELPCFNGADFTETRSERDLYELFVEKIRQGSDAIHTAIDALFGCFEFLFCHETPIDFRPLLFGEDGLKITPNYAYDYLRTLIGAYNELVNLPYFRQNKPRELPKEYPNFVSLGRIPASCWGEDDCRHEWQSTIVPTEGREEAQFYAKRLLELCKPANINFQAASVLTYTSSRSDQALLSQRSIPFYANQAKIREQWNFLATRRGLQTSIPPAQNCYIEGCDFVQVSGHLGQLASIGQDLRVDDLVFQDGSSLQNLKRDLNLPFQIKLCSLSEIRTGNLMRLREYFLLHPGLKPMGGVPKGGTLLLVLMQGEDGVRVLADFALPYYDWYQEPVVIDEKVIAQFIVESPNNFGHGMEDKMECYVFPLKEKDLKAEQFSLDVNFKSTSENAIEFEWKVDNNSKVLGKSSALQHQFIFNRDRAAFVMTLYAKNEKQSAVSVSKKIRGIYADFELDEELLGRQKETIKDVIKTRSYYKNESVTKISLILFLHVQNQEIFLRWRNTSLPTDLYTWKRFEYEGIDPLSIKETEDRGLNFELSLTVEEIIKEKQPYVIELNALHENTGIVDQKNMLLEIKVEKPRESTVAELETTLRIRHNQYRREAASVSNTHPELVQTRAFISLTGLFNSNDGAADLLKALKNSITQLSLDNREASVPTTVYQDLLASALNFTLDKLFFLFPEGLPPATNKALDAILKDLPAKTGYQLDQAALGSWQPEALGIPEHSKVLEALIKKFKV